MVSWFISPALCQCTAFRRPASENKSCSTEGIHGQQKPHLQSTRAKEARAWAMGTNGLIGADKGFEANSLVALLRDLWIRKSFRWDLFSFPSSVRRIKQAESVKLLLEAECQEIKKNLTEAQVMPQTKFTWKKTGSALHNLIMTSFLLWSLLLFCLISFSLKKNPNTTL